TMSAQLPRRSFLKASGVAGVAGLSARPGLAAATVVVSRSGPTRPLSPTFVGLNGNNLQQRLRWDRADLDTALAAVRPGALRYPGGTIGNYWSWRDGWFQGGGPWPGQTS